MASVSTSSGNEEVPMYEYYIDTGIIDYIYAS
jgi:hypothetical protein